MAIKKIDSIKDVTSSVKNIDDVVNSEKVPVDATVALDLVTAAAYQDAAIADANKASVEAELEERAESIIPETPEEPKVSADNIYTKKLILDESVTDFKLIDGSKDDADRYVEYDMFDFVYSLFSSETDSLIRPLKALSNIKSGRGRKKADAEGPSSFMYQGSDDYIDETGEKGVEGTAQISTDVDGNVVLYQDTESAFDAVIALCDEYGLEYEGPTAKRAPWLRWNFSFKVIVPTYADGYPMDVEDYFEKQGIALEDVMPPEFIKGRAKDYKKMNDEVVIESTFEKFVRKAANSNDDLNIFIVEMFDELNKAGVRYDKTSLKKRFLKEFEDDFEDEE